MNEDEEKKFEMLIGGKNLVSDGLAWGAPHVFSALARVAFFENSVFRPKKPLMEEILNRIETYCMTGQLDSDRIEDGLTQGAIDRIWELVKHEEEQIIDNLDRADLIAYMQLRLVPLKAVEKEKNEDGWN